MRSLIGHHRIRTSVYLGVDTVPVVRGTNFTEPAYYSFVATAAEALQREQ